MGLSKYIKKNEDDSYEISIEEAPQNEEIECEDGLKFQKVGNDEILITTKKGKFTPVGP